MNSIPPLKFGDAVMAKSGLVPISARAFWEECTRLVRTSVTRGREAEGRAMARVSLFLFQIAEFFPVPFELLRLERVMGVLAVVNDCTVAGGELGNCNYREIEYGAVVRREALEAI